MKRLKYLLLIAVLVLTIVGSYIYNYNLTSDISELSGNIDIDADGKIYSLYSTDSKNIFMRLNGNEVDSYYSQNIIDANNMHLFNNITVDSKQDIAYATLDILDNNTNRFISSSIVSFDTTIRNPVPQTIYELKLSEDEPLSNEYIKSVYSANGKIFFTTLSEDMLKAKLYSLSANGLTEPQLVTEYISDDSVVICSVICGQNYMVTVRADAKAHISNADGMFQLFPKSDSESRQFPVNLRVDANNNIYFKEVYSGELFTLDAYTGNILDTKQPNAPLFPGSTYTNDAASITAKYNESIQAAIVQPTTKVPIFPVLYKDGKVTELHNVKPSSGLIINKTVRTELFLLLGLLCCYILYKLLRIVYTARPTLLMKLLTFVLPIILLSMLLYTQVATSIFNNSIVRERNGLVDNVGNYVTQSVDLNLLNQITSPSSASSEAHSKLLKSISKATETSEYLITEYDDMRLYCVLMRVENDKVYTAVSYDMPCFMPIENIYSDDSLNLYTKAKAEKRSVTGKLKDSQGTWTVSIIPLFDSEGDIVGFLETGINSRDLDASMLKTFYYLLGAGAIVSVALLLAFFITLKISLNSLKRLKATVLSVYNGNYGDVVTIKTNDEVSDISRAFNKLSQDLDLQFNRLKKLNEAYFKFVSPDIISLLQKHSITDINLGDKVSKNMTFMNTTIKNFDKVVANLTPELTFKYINNLFKIIIGSVNGQAGIIHTFTVDKITALFQNSPDYALRSVIAIRSELNLYDSETFSSEEFSRMNSMEFRAGFVIHTAPCIYGIVGDDNRYSPAIVAENNDIIYALDTLQQSLKASILVTQSAFDGLVQPYTYNYRFIGHLATDSNNKVNLYEFFDGDKHQTLLGKKHTLQTFNTAMEAYMKSDFHNARNQFAKILKINPYDNVSRWFMFKCDDLCKLADKSEVEMEIVKI